MTIILKHTRVEIFDGVSRCLSHSPRDPEFSGVREKVQRSAAESAQINLTRSKE